MNPSQSSLKGLGNKYASFSDLKPRITVIGVGGAGGNAVNNMIRSQLEGVEFIVCNTDAQALGQSLSDKRIQLGLGATRGLGAGSRPDVGRVAAEEALEDVVESIKGSHMLFITAGMGGGTGTGAAPVLAKSARDLGILTVGVVTKPFHFEGIQRMRSAEKGLEELQQYVDTLIVIPNQNLFRIANEKTTFSDAFKLADDVLYSGVRGVTDLMIMPGLINLDFADVRSVMSEMGKAMMGTGEAKGERRAIDAAEAAISNPLLDDVSMQGARGVLINITGGFDMTLYEVDEAANRIREEVDTEAQIIFGSTFDEKMEGIMRVSVVATGIDLQGLKDHQGGPQMNHDLEKKQTSDTSSFSMGVMAGLSGNSATSLSEGLDFSQDLESSQEYDQAKEQNEHKKDFQEKDGLEDKAFNSGVHGHVKDAFEGTKPPSFQSIQGLSQPSSLQQWAQDHTDLKIEEPKPGFFERLTGFKISRTLKRDTENEQEGVGKEGREADFSVQGTLPGIEVQESGEEDLQIPAFLRRGQS